MTALCTAIAAASLLVAIFTAGVVDIAFRLEFVARRRWTNASVPAGAIALPAIASTLFAIALSVPNPFGTCHCAAHGLHHPHLCVFHPALAEPLLPFSSATLIGGALLVVPRMLTTIRAAIEAARFVRVVRDVTPVIVDDVPIRLLDIGAPQAFSIGLYSPVIVADSAFWRALGKQERRAIAHHENGHVERDDALTLLILRLLAAFCPWPADRARLEAWRRAAERSCDAHAARALGDPLCVAQALVATEQARAAFPRRHRLPELGLGIADCSNLEARVRDLLTETRSVAPLGNDLMGLVIASFGAAILTLAWPGGTVHHAVETVLGLILRL